MMRVRYIVLAATLMLGTIHGCPPMRASGCPDVTVQPVLDIAAYMGRWYEIERVPTPFQPSGACVTANYNLQNDPVYPVRVFNKMFNDNLGQYNSIVGGARKADNSGDGRLFVKFPVSPAESNYWVLETDYNSYALVFSCNENNGVTTQFSWILSRTNKLTAETSNKIEAAILRNGINRDLFVVTRHDNTCDYEA